MADNGKNLGKYLHKAKKPVDESGGMYRDGYAPGDETAKSKVNTKMVPNKKPSKSGGSGNVRG